MASKFSVCGAANQRFRASRQYGSVVTTNGRERARTQWERYKRVNQAFSKKVMEVYQPGDLIWVHNYQLILMPSYLIKKLPGACICFFMHQPWPSSELYRTLSKREEVRD